VLPCVVLLCSFSASYAGLQEWEKAVDDAKECIRLDPEFIKGYYRLATAQLESKDYDAGEATIKQGLNLDANNSQLLKTLRNIKQARKAALFAAANVNGKTNNNRQQQLDTAAARELHDLQMLHNKTAREYNTFQANLNKAQREEKMYGITLQELEKNPAASGNYYRSVGKIFVKSTQPQVVEHLEKNISGQKKKQQELTGKLEYLEKRLKSQQLNMKELTSGS
jgi:stress-induced-phosphoprotein 1